MTRPKNPQPRQTPHQMCRDLGWMEGNGSDPLGWDALVDVAARKYWITRTTPVKRVAA